MNCFPTCGNSASGPSALKSKIRLAEKTYVYQVGDKKYGNGLTSGSCFPNHLQNVLAVSLGYNLWDYDLNNSFMERGVLWYQVPFSSELNPSPNVELLCWPAEKTEPNRLEATIFQVWSLADIWDLASVKFWLYKIVCLSLYHLHKQCDL